MNLLPPPHKNAKVDKNKSMRKNCESQSSGSRPTFYSPAGSLMEIENKIDFGLVLEKIKKNLIPSVTHSKLAKRQRGNMHATIKHLLWEHTTKLQALSSLPERMLWNMHAHCVSDADQDVRAELVHPSQLSLVDAFKNYPLVRREIVFQRRHCR